METPSVNVADAPDSAPESPQSPLNSGFKPLQPDDMEPDEGLFGLRNSGGPLIFDDDEPMHEVSSTEKGEETPTVTIPADSSKSIVNIMVFYSDNSFQSFVPR